MTFTQDSNYCCVSAGLKRKNYLMLLDATTDKFGLMDIYRQKNKFKQGKPIFN